MLVLLLLSLFFFDVDVVMFVCCLLCVCWLCSVACWLVFVVWWLLSVVCRSLCELCCVAFVCFLLCASFCGVRCLLYVMYVDYVCCFCWLFVVAGCSVSPVVCYLVLFGASCL